MLLWLASDPNERPSVLLHTVEQRRTYHTIETDMYHTLLCLQHYHQTSQTFHQHWMKVAPRPGWFLFQQKQRLHILENRRVNLPHILAVLFNTSKQRWLSKGWWLTKQRLGTGERRLALKRTDHSTSSKNRPCSSRCKLQETKPPSLAFPLPAKWLLQLTGEAVVAVLPGPEGVKEPKGLANEELCGGPPIFSPPNPPNNPPVPPTPVEAGVGWRPTSAVYKRELYISWR